MRICFIVAGVVDLVSSLDEGQEVPEGWTLLPANSPVGPGYTFSGGVFTPPPPEFDVEAVPAFVSALQARLALLGVGLLDDVEQWANNPATPEAQRVYWQQASHLHRNHSMVAGIGALLGLSAMDVDILFIEAAKLS